MFVITKKWLDWIAFAYKRRNTFRVYQSTVLHAEINGDCVEQWKKVAWKIALWQLEKSKGIFTKMLQYIVKWKATGHGGYYSRRQVMLGAAREYCNLNKGKVEAADSPILAGRSRHGLSNSLPMLRLFGGSPKLTWQADCERNPKEAPFNGQTRA